MALGRMTVRAAWTSALLWLAGAPAQGAETAPLRVCVLSDNPPYSVQARAGGFDLEVAQAVAARVGRTASPIWIANARRVQELEESDLPTAQLARGACDAVFSMPGPATDSLRGTDGLVLGAPYYGAAFELLSCGAIADSTLAALGRRKLAIQAATIAHFAALELGAEPVTYFSPEAALEGLRKGEAELALLWGPAAGALLATAETDPPGCALTTADQPLPALRWNLHVATREADRDLRETIDEALAGLRTDGELARIARHHGVPPHAPFPTTYSAEALRRLAPAAQ